MRKAGLLALEPQRFRLSRTPVDAEEDEVEDAASLELLAGAEDELLDVVEEEDTFCAELLETPAEELLVAPEEDETTTGS